MALRLGVNEVANEKGLNMGKLQCDTDIALYLSLTKIETAGTMVASQLVTIHIATHLRSPHADLDVCFQPFSIGFHDSPTLSRTSTQKQRAFPRLIFNLEQAKQGVAETGETKSIANNFFPSKRVPARFCA